MKVKNFKNFLFEWGYGGEGGVASKDPIKVRDGMFTEIDPLEDEEEEEDKDIPVLKESNVPEDPYGEEDWNEADTEWSYIKWKSSLYSWLKQLKNPFIEEQLNLIRNSSKRDYRRLRDLYNDIISELEYDEGVNLPNNEIKAVENNLDELEVLCYDYDDEPEDEGPDPDEWYDRKREREME